MPVLGFNSSRYDLNLIREHLVERLASAAGDIKVAKNANKIMFLWTKEFRFLDIINYLGPGTGYDKWVKAYVCTAEKSWFPYEWFDSPQKLDYPGLPDYPAWHSRLKEKFFAHAGRMERVQARVLCSKRYFVEEENNGKNKLSTKGMSKGAERGHVGDVSKRRLKGAKTLSLAGLAAPACPAGL